MTIVVQWKGPGEADFGHDVAVVRPVQVLSNAGWAGALVPFRTKAVDAAAHEALSAGAAVQFYGGGAEGCEGGAGHRGHRGPN